MLLASILLFASLCQAATPLPSVSTGTIEANTLDLYRRIKADSIRYGNPVKTNVTLSSSAIISGTLNVSSNVVAVGNIISKSSFSTTGVVEMGWERVAGSSTTINSGACGNASVSCSTGKNVIGGGCALSQLDSSNSQSAITSYANSDTSWFCNWCNATTTDGVTLAAKILCARIKP